MAQAVVCHCLSDPRSIPSSNSSHIQRHAHVGWKVIRLLYITPDVGGRQVIEVS